MWDERPNASAAYLRAGDEQHVRELKAIIAEHNRTCEEGAECESCVAPRLARENLILRVECDNHQRDAGQWWGELATANGELLRLRAIVEGRTAPPTDDQIREHLRDKPDNSTGLHRGSWLITSEYGGLPLVRRNAETCIRIATEQRLRCIGWCWIALDRNGRPCAWPVTP